MSKDEISYQILYRYSLEKLYSTLTRRVDNLLSFALIFLGVGVTINVGSPFILGPGIVGIAILKEYSASARDQPKPTGSPAPG